MIDVTKREEASVLKPFICMDVGDTFQLNGSLFIKIDEENAFGPETNTVETGSNLNAVYPMCDAKLEWWPRTGGLE